MKPSPDVGASAIEYGLLIAAIVGVLVAVVYAMGPVVLGTFQQGRCAFLTQESSTTDC